MNLTYALALTAYAYENLGATAAAVNVRYAGICSAVSSLRHAVARQVYLYFPPMGPFHGYAVDIDEFDIHAEVIDEAKYFTRLMHYDRALMDAVEKKADAASSDDVREDYVYVLEHIKMTTRVVRSAHEYFAAGVGEIYGEGQICTACGHAFDDYEGGGGGDCWRCGGAARGIVPIAQIC